MENDNAKPKAQNADPIHPVDGNNIEMQTKEDKAASLNSGIILDEPFKHKTPTESSDTTKATGSTPKTALQQYTSTKDAMTMVTPLERLDEEPAFIDCPYCEKRTKTSVTKENSSQTMLAAAFCCLCCGVITVLVPLICHWCADIDHQCSECKKLVAHKPHEGQTQPVLPQQTPAQTVSKYVGS